MATDPAPGSLPAGGLDESWPWWPALEPPAGSPSARALAVQAQASTAYHLEPTLDENRAHGTNRAHGLDLELGPGGMRVTSNSMAGSWELGLRCVAAGRPGALEPIPPGAASSLSCVTNRASFGRAEGLREWYVNGPLGIEHGFTWTERPAGGTAPLVIELAVEGFDPTLLPGAEGVRLSLAEGGTQLRYDGLEVWDATGRLLPSWMEVGGGDIRLRIDDRDARYPLSIDPLVWAQQHRITDDEGEPPDCFGSLVRLSGDTALVGAPLVGDFDGAAFVFVRTGATWSKQAKLVVSDEVPSDHDGFGSTGDIRSDTAFVGASANHEVAANADRQHLAPLVQPGAPRFAEGPRGMTTTAREVASCGRSVDGLREDRCAAR